MVAEAVGAAEVAGVEAAAVPLFVEMESKRVRNSAIRSGMRAVLLD